MLRKIGLTLTTWLILTGALGFNQVVAQVASCRPTASAPTYTAGAPSPLSCDLSGNLRSVQGGAGGAQDVNITKVGGNAVTTTVPTADATTQSNTGTTATNTGTTATNTGTTATNTGTTNTNLGAPGATACASDTASCSLNQLLQRIAQRITSLITTMGSPMQNTGGTVAATQSGTWNVGQSSQYPAGAVPETASATGTTAATTATLAAAVGKTTFICGFSIRANATAAATGDSTVTGTITGTLHFTQWTAPLASGIGLTEMIFPTCIPATGTNATIAVVSAAPGSGGVVSVSAWGYQL